jgi:hypothetical protein
MKNVLFCLLMLLVVGCLAGCHPNNDQAARAAAAKEQADANAKAAMRYVDPHAGYKPQEIRPAGAPAAAGTARQ